MYKRYNMALVLSAVVAIVISTHNTVPAQISYSDSPPEPRFFSTLGGGWGNYDMKRISGIYIEGDQQEHYFDIPSNNERISGGPGLFGDAGINVLRNWSISAGILYLTGEGKLPSSDQSFLDDYNNRTPRPTQFLSADLLAPNMKLQYNLVIDPLHLFSNVGMAYLFGRINYPVYTGGPVVPPQLPPMVKRPFSAQGIGYLFSVGAFFRIAGLFDIGSEMGFRVLKVGTPKDNDGNEWDGLDIGFSGPYVAGRVSLVL